jgi:hypothetical protein
MALILHNARNCSCDTENNQLYIVSNWWLDKYWLGIPVERATIVKEFPLELLKTKQDPMRVLQYYITYMKQIGWVQDTEDPEMWARELKQREIDEAYWGPRRAPLDEALNAQIEAMQRRRAAEIAGDKKGMREARKARREAEAEQRRIRAPGWTSSAKTGETK